MAGLRSVDGALILDRFPPPLFLPEPPDPSVVLLLAVRLRCLELAMLGAADANSESLTDVLDRVRGVTRVPPGTHERLAEALSRTARSAPTTDGEDLHSRLRKALVRP